MTAIADLLRIAPLVQSATLVNENVKFAKKKKKKAKGFVGLGVKNIIGMEFIAAESNLIAGI